MVNKRSNSSRRIKGTRVKPVLKAFNCRSCGSPVKVNVVGQTLNVVCPSCKSIIDAKDPNFKVLQESKSKKKWFPAIPIGALGKLKGTLWKNIGYVVKQDSGYYWSEYLLYNPYKGYRWLSEVNGHWVLYKKIYRASGVTGSPQAKYKGKKYKLFNHGTAKVEYVEGEFYWRVKRGDTASVSDYVLPPEGLSVEYSKHEENWALGTHIEAETLRKSFKIKNEFPYQQGVGMLEPSPFKKKASQNVKVLLTSLAVLFVIFFLRKITAKNEQVFFTYLDDKHTVRSNTLTTKTDEFEITGRNSNVEIRGRAPVYNSWVYVDALLVDANTQKGIPMPREISYYRG
ncbi:MAG: DUF4178 domain-containing protein, partial [Halobacteriovoraceae bacterium]|nr:DUF4178 domain-containing protein [Halobacteriovoraceae bacterium]